MITVGIEHSDLEGLTRHGEHIRDGYKKGIKRSGLYLERKVVRKINSNIGPKLSPATIKKKGSSKALVDSGELRSEITSKTFGTDVAEVGVFGGRADIATIHEFGAVIERQRKSQGTHLGVDIRGGDVRIIIPERSFLRSTANEENNKIFDIIAKEIDKAIKKK